MEKEFIIDHKVRFGKETGFYYIFPLGCLITPIWKRGRIIRLLVTDRSDGKTFYVDVVAKYMTIETFCNVCHLQQGGTYVVDDASTLMILTNLIVISKN